jgi:AFG3 family protein
MNGDNEKPQAPPPGDAPPPRRRFSPYWVYAVILLALFLSYLLSPTRAVREITWQQFERDLLSRHAVEKVVVVNNQMAEVYLPDSLQHDSAYSDVFRTPFGGIRPGPHVMFTIGSVETFERKLTEAEKNFTEDQKINVIYTQRTNWLIELLPWLLPLALLYFLWRGAFRRMGAGGAGGASPFSFGKSTAQLMEKENRSTATFDDVAGLEEAKVEVKEIVDFLKDPRKFTRLGAKIPKGVIIVGPPGTGKTLLVRAVAGEAKVPFFSISGSEFVEMFVGVGASRVRDLFKRAKQKAPCIVFIDEIDAVGRSRGRNTFYSGANDERESTLNQLLTEMDGFGTNTGIIVLAATNRADMLDPALLRPGRFDRHIYLDLPTLEERKAIFRVHMRPLVLDDTADVAFLAAQTPGFSGADIANICNEAALIAARHQREKIGRQDFMDAIDRIVAGLEKKSKIISPAEKAIIAHHEAGHAVASWFLEHVDPLTKVSIVPRGKTLGAAWYLPEERQLQTTAQMSDRMCATLGGRVAEDLIFHDVSSGAVDDLEKVTRDAYSMVAIFGFNEKIGHISFYDSTGLRDATIQKPYSEETGSMIDEEVRHLVDRAYRRTRKLLEDHLDGLKQVAQLLLKKEVIYREDLERILGPRPSTPSLNP